MKLQAIQADITTLQVEAIVNAANTSLLGGGGVDGAIHRAAGPALLEECRAIRNRQGGCNTGEAVITGGGKLPARWVIHTVGPVWDGRNGEKKKDLLRQCYRSCLKLAQQHGIRSIAFPSISTGAYGFPKEEAAKIAVEAVQTFEGADGIEEVFFVCFFKGDLAIYENILS